MSEAISLACSLLENQMKIERKDSIDRAWEFTCGWVVRNKHKFITPTTIEINNEVYGRIDSEYCYVITDVLQKALKEAGFSSDLKCIKGFAERGYIGTFEERGKPCIQPSKSIRGSNIRAYGLKIKSSLAGQSQSQAGLAGQDEEDILA